MKYKKIKSLLGLNEIKLNAGVFVNKKPFARIYEDELEVLEEALKNNDSQQELIQIKNKIKELESAVAQALEIAGLQCQDNLQASIAALGNKCKEYGESKQRHTFAETTGQDEQACGLVEGYLDPNDEHNQLLKSL